MNQTQLDGITKARLADNITRVSTGDLHADDAAYIAFVCASAGLETLPDYAADSYSAQFAGKTIAGLEAELEAAIDKAAESPSPPADLPTPTVAGIPTRVTMRQARLALLGAGLLDAVSAAVASAGQAAQIEWEYAAVVERNYGLIPAMAAALGMKDEQVDALFVAAAAL